MTAKLYRCCVPDCPGYPYPASQVPHPCVEKPERDPLEEFLESILGDAERCVERGDLQGADESLQIAFEVSDGSPLLHVLSAHVTSLDLRRHKLVAWVQEARKRLPEPILEASCRKN